MRRPQLWAAQRIGLLAALLCVALLACDNSKAAMHYQQCVDMVNRSELEAALGQCQRAVDIDPNCRSGRLAAKKLAQIAPTASAAASARAKAEADRKKAEADAKAALLAKYRAMTKAERVDAMKRCYDRLPRCTEQERAAILDTAADPDERASLQSVADARTPTEVSFEALAKLSATGMTVGKPYKVCTAYDGIGLGSPPNEISVDDNFATGSDELRALYDRRGKTSCFEVRMFRDSKLRITALL